MFKILQISRVCVLFFLFRHRNHIQFPKIKTYIGIIKRKSKPELSCNVLNTMYSRQFVCKKERAKIDACKICVLDWSDFAT